MDSNTDAVRESRIETWSLGAGVTANTDSISMERHVALQLALGSTSDGGERMAISDWEGIHVGGTLHLFGYVRELYA